MADDPNDPESTSPPQAEAAGSAAAVGSEGAASPRRRVSWPAVLALAALGILVVLQTAGLLLRDRLERRQPTLAEAPAVIGEPDSEPGTGRTGKRFGPEVQEISVAGSGEPAPALTPPPAPPAEPQVPDVMEEKPPPPPPAPPPEPVAAPRPAPAQEPVAASAPPPPEPPTAPAERRVVGTHALQVGLFGSQKYRHEMEQQLEAAGFPHFRQLRHKKGTGYRLAIPLAGEQEEIRAQKAMDAAGYVYRIEDRSLEAYFHFEEEAQRALRKLAEVGLKGGYGRVEEELPLWVVYAGPFSEDEAKKVRQQLAILGLPSYLRSVP